MNGVEIIEDASPEDSHLTVLIHAFDWTGVLARIQSAPDDISSRGPQGRLPLHVAVDHDAPAVVVQALVSAFPRASAMVGSSNMNPLHITVSSAHASVHTVRVLLELGDPMQLRQQDIDGDTPLHAACRAGAPIEVIEVLLRTYPEAVHILDDEGLSPIYRLWIRCYIIAGEEKINNIRNEADIDGEMREVWNKTELLLKCAKHGSLDVEDFKLLHAATSVDCPRAVVKIAATIYPNQLEEVDQDGYLPLHHAIKAPVFAFRDLTSERDYDDFDDPLQDSIQNEQQVDNGPSVIDILLEADAEKASSTVRIPMPGTKQLPLHAALAGQKKWNDGIRALVELFPESLVERDSEFKFPAFLLASIGENTDTWTIFELIRWNPSILRDLLKC